MTELVKIDLDGPGACHLNSWLVGGGAISQAFLQRFGSVTGAYAPLPQGIGAAETLEFGHGGLTTEEATLSWLASEMQRRFDTASELSMWMEDLSARPTDPYLHRSGDRVFTAGDTVIHAASRPALGLAGLTALLASVASFHYIGYVALYPMPPLVRIINHLSTDFIGGLASAARIVLMGAYDRDGLILSDVHEFSRRPTPASG